MYHGWPCLCCFCKFYNVHNVKRLPYPLLHSAQFEHIHYCPVSLVIIFFWISVFGAYIYPQSILDRHDGPPSHVYHHLDNAELYMY